MNSSECPLCFCQCDNLVQLQTHIINCRQTNKHICQYCKQTFTRKTSLDRHHNKKRCKKEKITITKISLKDLKLHEFEEIKDRIVKLEKEKSKSTVNSLNIINNNLNIVCVGSRDNYLDLLTEK